MLIWTDKKNKLLTLPESLKSIRLLPRLPMVSFNLYSEVLAKVIKKVSVGSKIFDLCLLGDSSLIEELNKVYNKKPVFKGIAFPTCISVNEICGYNSPMPE